MIYPWETSTRLIYDYEVDMVSGELSHMTITHWRCFECNEKHPWPEDAEHPMFVDEVEIRVPKGCINTACKLFSVPFRHYIRIDEDFVDGLNAQVKVKWEELKRKGMERNDDPS